MRRPIFLNSAYEGMSTPPDVIVKSSAISLSTACELRDCHTRAQKFSMISAAPPRVIGPLPFVIELLWDYEWDAFVSKASAERAFGAGRTTARVPSGTRPWRSIMSWFRSRMQPLEIDWTIELGFTVPWMRESW